MKALKRNVMIAVGELLIILMLFASATYAFFSVTTKLEINEMHLQVQTVGQILIRNVDDPLDEFGEDITFNWDSENETIYNEVTTVDGVNFFHEFYDQPAIFGEGILVRDFAFTSVADNNVYLTDPGSGVFQTIETETAADVVNALRVGFITYTYNQQNEKVYDLSSFHIYAKIREQTFVYQDPSFQSEQQEIEGEMFNGVTVTNFTNLGVVGGESLFFVNANQETFVRVMVWVEGNDPDSIAKIATANFSVHLSFKGEAYVG